MNKKLRMILFSLALVGFSISGTTKAMRDNVKLVLVNITAPDQPVKMAPYDNVCASLGSFCITHPKTTVTVLAAMAVLMAPGASRAARFTLRKIDDYRKKLFVLALIVAACWAGRWSDRRWNKCEKVDEGRIVQWILDHYEELWNQSIKESRPECFVRENLLKPADTQVREFLNWSSGYILKVMGWLGLHNPQDRGGDDAGGSAKLYPIPEVL